MFSEFQLYTSISFNDNLNIVESSVWSSVVSSLARNDELMRR